MSASATMPRNAKSMPTAPTTVRLVSRTVALSVLPSLLSAWLAREAFRGSREAHARDKLRLSLVCAFSCRESARVMLAASLDPSIPATVELETISRDDDVSEPMKIQSVASENDIIEAAGEEISEFPN